VAESRVAGTSVAEVARRHGVNANQVFAWRRQQDQGVLGQHTHPRLATRNEPTSARIVVVFITQPLY
jgi:transposase-like protein